MQYNRIVLNEPHASIEGLYDERLSFWNVDEKFVNDIVLKWTDWHTDYLFYGYRKENIRTVRFPYSRFIVDAERLWNDPLGAKDKVSYINSLRVMSAVFPKNTRQTY